MKKLSTLSFVLMLSLFTKGQAKNTPNPTNKNAKQNQTVWLCTYRVKADKQKEYEHFVHDIFWPGAKKLSKAEQQVFRQTRVMHPLKAEADGAFIYSFLMDPVIEGGDYEIDSLLKKMFGEKAGTEYFKQFVATLTDEADYRQYYMVQSKD
jgi:hypothetical protein